MSYEAGLAAFQQNKFEDAIAYLLEYCRECDAADAVTSQKYMQAHRGIVKCYQQLGQMDQAIAHCQGLTATKNTALNIWIDRSLPKLEAEAAAVVKRQADEVENDGAVIESMPPNNEPDNEMLLHQGIQAYKNMKRDRAIQLLEQYTAACTRLNSRDYMNAEMTLVKTYREVKDFGKAIARCETLAHSKNFALKSWASKALPKLQEEEAKISPSATQEMVTTPQPLTVSPGVNASPQPAPSTPPPQVSPSVKPNGDQMASSSYIFDASPNGSGNLRRVEPSPYPLSSRSASSSAQGSGSSLTAPTGAAPASSSPPGDIPDSMAAGLAAVPKRTHSRARTKPTSSSRSSRSNNTPKASMGGGAIGGGLAILGQLLMGRMLRGGIGFAVFVVIMIARSCFNIGSDMTALQTAVAEGDVATVELLLNQGKPMETADDSGNTVIFWALDAAECDFDVTDCTLGTEQQAIANLLISKGANVNAVNTWQETPLHWAANSSGSADIVQDLIGRGANVNAQDSTQNTPLHWASAAGILENVEVLLNNGADINAKDADGYTPLDYAGTEDVAKLLQSRQAISGF
ncbi:MAG: ankyrin repeat domain-containing protein [Leptolyngbyaceae bacterium]|nr:ankyrin repeat domain-containing protein [Leptolyngbyaceae bacterium]